MRGPHVMVLTAHSHGAPLQVLDALYSGDLGFAAPLFDALASNHTYASALQPNGLVHADGVGALVDTSGGRKYPCVSTQST